MRKKIFSLVLILIMAGSLVAADICFAEEDPAGTTPNGETPKQTLFERTASTTTPSKVNMVYRLPSGDWKIIMAKVINLVLGVTGSLALASFTFGGILMVTAQGKDEQISKGKNILYWSIMALAIIAASYGIVVGVTQLQFFQ
jgi:hypothetical protein